MPSSAFIQLSATQQGYYYAVTQDRVLLGSPENQTVVGVFAEDKAR
jgi:hypothetical protein